VERRRKRKRQRQQKREEGRGKREEGSARREDEERLVNSRVHSHGGAHNSRDDLLILSDNVCERSNGKTPVSDLSSSQQRLNTSDGQGETDGTPEVCA
jgi:sRNA-binding protein